MLPNLLCYIELVVTRGSLRRIEQIERKLIKRGIAVLNLCGPDFRLRILQAPNETVARCYASGLGNCTGPISREHYISENILKQLNTVNLDAFPWLNGKSSSVAPTELVAKCLCAYHNAFLSPLDNLAGKVFDNFVALPDPASPNVLIWGPSLARWCLKALVGLVGSKQVLVKEERIAPTDLPAEWIEILFGLREFPAGQGLYMAPVVGGKISFSKQISLATLILDGQLQGVRVSIAGVEFILSMADPEKAFNKSHPAFATLLPLPRGLTLNQRQDRVAIFWD